MNFYSTPSFRPAALTKKAADTDFSIINRLASEFADLSKKDIQYWRNAIEAASNPQSPKWVMLQDLYEYLRSDAHLGSQMDIRRGATEGNRYYVRDSKTNKENPEKTKFMEQEWIFDLIGDLLDHVFFGYTVLQITDPALGSYDLLPRRNFIPQKNLILLEASGEKGLLVDDPIFQGSIIVIKSRDKFGLINDIVPDLIWKKNARQAWATFSEKFGIPLITATTLSRDKKELDRIEAMLRALGKAAQAVFPQGTAIEIMDQAAKGDPYNVFLKQMEYCDAQISKRILGGTMISDNGASRAQGTVHENTMSIITERDRKKIEYCINNKVKPALKIFGEADEFVFDRSQQLSLTEHWSIISAALDKGYQIDDDWMSSKFNFPITGKSMPVVSGISPPENKPADPVAQVGFFD